jgi:hypothetical protein
MPCLASAGPINQCGLYDNARGVYLLLNQGVYRVLYNDDVAVVLLQMLTNGSVY